MKDLNELLDQIKEELDYIAQTTVKPEIMDEVIERARSIQDITVDVAESIDTHTQYLDVITALMKSDEAGLNGFKQELTKYLDNERYKESARKFIQLINSVEYSQRNLIKNLVRNVQRELRKLKLSYSADMHPILTKLAQETIELRVFINQNKDN